MYCIHFKILDCLMANTFSERQDSKIQSLELLLQNAGLLQDVGEADSLTTQLPIVNNKKSCF